MNRRTFLQSSLATAALTSLPRHAFAATHKIEKVGAQLYTVRDLLKGDFDGTIAKMAAIGYKELEGGDYGHYTPREIRAIFEKNGLTAPSTHIGYEAVEKKLPEKIAAAQIIGHKFMVCPSIPDEMRAAPDGYKKALGVLNKAGEATKKAGIQFAYHNHYQEFEPIPSLDGKFAFDYMLENSDPANLQFEMDLCWISVAGQDPIAYFNKYPGRFPLVHVKDLSALPHLPPAKLSAFNIDSAKVNMVSVGSGVIDWKKIFSYSDKAGIQHYFVEQDVSKDPYADLTASFGYLSKLRF